MQMNIAERFAPARLACALRQWLLRALPTYDNRPVPPPADKDLDFRVIKVGDAQGPGEPHVRLGFGLCADRDAERLGSPDPREEALQTDTATSVLVYCAGCEGLKRLGTELNIPVFKIGVTASVDVERRLLRLGASRYASVIKNGDGGALQQGGFDCWHAQTFTDPQVPTSSAICRTMKGITVTLPRQMSPGQFEARLRTRLKTRSLFTATGRTRFTARGGDDSLAAATELVRFRPRNRGDVAALVSTIEAIITEAS